MVIARGRVAREVDHSRLYQEQYIGTIESAGSNIKAGLIQDISSNGFPP